MYHMKAVFDIDISMKSLNGMTERIDGGHVVLHNAMQTTLEQTIPFVPDKEMLAKYANIIKNAGDVNDIHIEDVRFSHYEIFEEVPET